MQLNIHYFRKVKPQTKRVQGKFIYLKSKEFYLVFA